MRRPRDTARSAAAASASAHTYTHAQNCTQETRGESSHPRKHTRAHTERHGDRSKHVRAPALAGTHTPKRGNKHRAAVPQSPPCDAPGSIVGVSPTAAVNCRPSCHSVGRSGSMRSCTARSPGSDAGPDRWKRTLALAASSAPCFSSGFTFLGYSLSSLSFCSSACRDARISLDGAVSHMRHSRGCSSSERARHERQISGSTTTAPHATPPRARTTNSSTENSPSCVSLLACAPPASAATARAAAAATVRTAAPRARSVSCIAAETHTQWMHTGR